LLPSRHRCSAESQARKWQRRKTTTEDHDLPRIPLSEELKEKESAVESRKKERKKQGYGDSEAR
jgi:hypothetical protein